jgi:hypothetical protein
MIDQIKKNYKIILLIWLGCGFLMGSMETFFARACFQKRCPSGCTYESAAFVLMPGRVLACELFRARYSLEGFGEHL